MATTNFRLARTDPDNYDDINLGSDSESLGNDRETEVVVDSKEGTLHYKDVSPEHITDTSEKQNQSNLSQDTYLAGGDYTGKTALEEEIDALLSDESDELLRGGDIQMKPIGGDEGEGRFVIHCRCYITWDICSTEDPVASKFEARKEQKGARNFSGGQDP